MVLMVRPLAVCVGRVEISGVRHARRLQTAGVAGQCSSSVIHSVVRALYFFHNTFVNCPPGR